MRRRDFIAGLGSVAWPLTARAQQRALPVVAFVHPGSADALAFNAVAFRTGLSETGFVEGQNVTVEYHWLNGQYNGAPPLMADIVRRRVAVIFTVDALAEAAKAATTTIPIVFIVTEDPVERGLVASYPRPGGNLTGINGLSQEVVTKQLGLLHQLLPSAVRIAVLINPASPANVAATLPQAEKAAQVLGLQVQIVKASTSRDIDAVFASFERERPDALLQTSDPFFCESPGPTYHAGGA